MKKMGFMYAFLILLGSFSAPAAWAGGGGHHGGHHHGGHHGGHHHGGYWHGPGLAFGLGVLGGYSLGYYGRSPYYPPYYRYGPAYGYAPYGYPASGFTPWYGYTPGYAYPPAAPVVVTPAPPPVYIQQPPVIQSQPQPPATSYWHYCRNPEGYYPYVKNCPEGWLQVAPQPDQ
ncbi:MAG: proline-rich region [Nitrosospira multiformis]|jgi:hypothetical protein|nr:proline-rich region [Nitrosospira multiformis]